MATVFSHPAVAIALIPCFQKIADKPAILAIGLILTVLPDLDVIGFFLGIPYEHIFGHRGFTHSLIFAAGLSAIVARVLSRLDVVEVNRVWPYFFLCLASHGIIDACTDGGLGIGFFSPFSNERYFFAFQPIKVSPLGIEAFFSDRGVAVLKSELIWLWLPCLTFWYLAARGAKNFFAASLPKND